MKYFSLNEILGAVFLFILLGITSKILHSLLKGLLKAIKSTLGIIFAEITSAINYHKDINVSISYNRKVFQYLFEFCYSSIVCVFFMLASYQTVDGTLRVVLLICFIAGFISTHFFIRLSVKYFLPFYMWLSKWFLLFFGLFLKILFLPLRFFAVLFKFSILQVFSKSCQKKGK